MKGFIFKIHIAEIVGLNNGLYKAVYRFTIMSRQLYRQVGLIAALVVASVSLPIGIIGLTREALVVNNYYNTYNNQTYYNQTYYDETYYFNETTPIEERINYPLIREDYSFNDTHFYENRTYIYNMTRDTFLYLLRNQTVSEVQITIHVYLLDWYSRGIMYEETIHTVTSGGLIALASISLGFAGTWVFIFEIEDLYQNAIDVNVTVYHQIRYY